MRFLVCLAFWLSVVLYYLPSFEPKRAPLEPRKTANISRSTNTPTADAGRPSCARNARSCDRPGNRASNNSEQTTQNTLRLSDLAPPWRGTIEHRRR